MTNLSGQTVSVVSTFGTRLAGWKKLLTFYFLTVSRTLAGYLKYILPIGSFAGLLAVFYLSVMYLTPAIQSNIRPDENPILKATIPAAGAEGQKELKKLDKEVQLLQKKFDRQTPRDKYMVINSVRNEFRVYQGKNLLYKGRCSTGSYILLKGGDDQEWLFRTPKGEFRVRGKTRFPVWIKPDWAFIEEGMPVPPANHNSRYEYGVLGDYALSLGDGYLIHGTIYQRFLGLPVTHGCVRLNDQDLEYVYRALDSGSKIYIY